MEGKSSTQMVHFLPDVCQLLSTFYRCSFRFGKKLKLLNCSSGHVKCSFDNLAENFSPKVRKCFTQSPKMVIYLQFLEKNYFRSESSSGHVECSFDNNAENFLVSF